MKRTTFATLVAVSASLITSVASATDMASIVRGGRLYDNLSQELKIRTPNRPNPAFKTQQVRVAIADTWRCSQCHGWDYKGANGVVGITGKLKADPAAIVAVLKNPTHVGYEELLDDGDRLDLANFVAYGQTDMPKLVDAAKHVKANANSSEKIFATVCANCHGLEGDRLRQIPPLGDAARQRPFEILHVAFNGHPGGDMPALRSLGDDTVTKMLAYMQTLRSVNLPSSIANGGRLYDDWQAQLGGRLQALPHPSYPVKGYYANVPSETWRCKECHGWDYKGNQGAYASGIHATGTKGIRAMVGADPAKIMGVLSSSVHLFGNVMKYRDLLDLANFVSAGQVDVDKIIDVRTGKAKGDAAQGAPHFRTMCAACHSLDGRSPGKRFIGRVSNEDPYHALHNMLNGHPDDTMPALREVDPKVINDLLAHMQSLPVKR